MGRMDSRATRLVHEALDWARKAERDRNEGTDEVAVSCAYDAVVLVEANARLLDRAMALLGQIEWMEQSEFDRLPCCPCCKRYKMWGHANDCELAVIMDEYGHRATE